MLTWKDMGDGAEVAVWSEPKEGCKRKFVYALARVEKNGDTRIVGDNWKERCKGIEKCRRRHNRGQCETCWRRDLMRLRSKSQARAVIEQLVEMYGAKP